MGEWQIIIQLEDQCERVGIVNVKWVGIIKIEYVYIAKSGKKDVYVVELDFLFLECKKNT